MNRAKASASTESARDIESLLIVRLGAMGDIIHAMPAVTALRNAFAQMEIGWLVEERWTELLCTPSTARCGTRSAQRPLVDRVHTVDTKRWRRSWTNPNTWKRIAYGLVEVRASHYQVAVDLQGAIRSALLARWSGAPLIYGSAAPRERPAAMFYSRQIAICREHVVEQSLSIVEAVTKSSLTMGDAEFPRDNSAEQHWDAFLQGNGIRQFILINPGAGWGAKRWPAELYGEVVRALARDGLKSLINFGPGEKTLADAVVGASGGAAVALGSSITELIALTRRASLFIGGDTGPMHLAAALRIPVVAIFGPTDPARNGPYGTRSFVLRNPTSVTDHSRIAEPEPGLLTITSAQVVEAARQLLGENV